MAAIKCVCLIAALLLLSATAVSAVSFGLRESTCTSSWAVKVNGGLERAKLIAANHGFEIREKVGNLRDIYHFSVGKKSMASMPLEAAAQYSSALKEDPNIDSAEQQCFRKRSKRQTLSDPVFNDQWYLLNTGQFGLNFAGRDHRMQRVWLQGVTGCNVTVAVVDDGVEHTHPDLQPNYDHFLDYDYIGGTDDAFPYSYFTQRDSHGTSVAGIIAAAKDNDVCGVGGSYYSTITGINILADIEGVAVSTDMTEGGALSHQNTIVDIYSNSWGPPDTGYQANKPGPLASMALEMGAREGRQGKGVIFTFAAGNGGSSHDSCAADGYTNSIYTISVGAAGIDGKAAYYDEICSAKLVSAYVENHIYYLPKVTTATTYAQCSSYFDGTSAATPIISSIVALTLEANPNLTWRDVQYLLVYTSVSDLVSENDEWRVNGAGLRYSHQFGFGVADAEAMVTRARHWVNVPVQQMDSIQLERTSGEFSDAISVTFTYDGDISFLEHLVVTTTLNLTSDVHSDDDIMAAFELVLGVYVTEGQFKNASELLLKRGDIQIELLSPSGSKSILLPYRDNDIVPYASFPSNLSAEILEYISLESVLPDGYIDWPFMSVHYWGENPRGEWTLTFHYRGVDDLVTFEGLNVTLYGTLETPEAITNYTECNTLCGGGCARAGSSVFCHSCSNLRHAETLECIDVCPPGYLDLNGYCHNASKPEPECAKSLETPPRGSCVEAGYESCCSSGECSGSVRSCYCDEECRMLGDCCQDIVSTCVHKSVTITFLDIQNATVGVTKRGSVPMGDTVLSMVETPEPFPFGHEFFTRLYVLEDGYISFGEFEMAAVLPFYSDADTTTSGAVNYITVNGGPLLSRLNSLIRAKQSVYFKGTWALIVEWKDIPEYFSIHNETNTFQGALITDGRHSYTVFIYMCGLLAYGNLQDAGIGVYSENATLVNLNRIVNTLYYAETLACANLPNEWNTLVYALAEPIDTVVCTTNVGNPPHRATLNCSAPPAGIVNVTCFLPGSAIKIICSNFPVVVNTVQFPLGESIIKVVGYTADAGEELLLGKASVVIPDIDVRFTSGTPLVGVGSVHAQFENNRADADIYCIVTGFARSECSAGTYSLSSVPGGHKRLKVIVKDVIRNEHKVIRMYLPMPENGDVCYTHLINRGWRVDGNTFTVEFTSTGNARGYTCILDRMYFFDNCSTPLVFRDLQPGRHNVRIVPQGCKNKHKVWSQTFYIT